MARIKSQIKRIRTNEKAHQRNLKFKKEIKKMIKKIKLAVKNKDKTLINDYLKKITSLFDKSVNKNIFHINTVSRRKSRITKLVNKTI